jgi:hypothetical protein
MKGWRIAFNGFEGRMETWQDIPYQDDNQVNQEQATCTGNGAG